MENFLLSHYWVSLGVCHVLACKQKAECVSSNHMFFEFLLTYCLEFRVTDENFHLPLTMQISFGTRNCVDFRMFYKLPMQTLPNTKVSLFNPKLLFHPSQRCHIPDII